MQILNPFVTSTISELASEILRISLKNLGLRYSVDIKYVLSKKVEDEFHRCLDVAIQAFLRYVSENGNLEKQIKQKVILDYLKSSSVTEEIWHLLEPGSEIFDKGLLAQYAEETLSPSSGESVRKLIFDAWEEFLKAFSFASRSAPELREFLRASYEAGNFRALSNIEDVLDNMNTAISSFKDEELMVSHAIKSYAEELQEYKTWAINF
jgi:hypothetical protein